VHLTLLSLLQELEEKLRASIPSQIAAITSSLKRIFGFILNVSLKNKESYLPLTIRSSIENFFFPYLSQVTLRELFRESKQPTHPLAFRKRSSAFLKDRYSFFLKLSKIQPLS